ncbi:LAETG motif-containing sortase-dependent surface protein [Streptomyces sp. NPDC093260]|uniref:LAETG motif-containing sortase-dependent surface protein n=1 Tax=Streptomyces sp. NPDC093260 TaxID=3155073 RepID=UPI00341AE226
MSSARRTLLTATAAGTLLGALWFVPSASATGEAPARTTSGAAPVASAARDAGDGRGEGLTLSSSGSGGAHAAGFRAAAADTEADGANSAASPGGSEQAGAGEGTLLADTGSIDTTPYVVGGSVFLALGAGFVVYSVRRERLGL